MATSKLITKLQKLVKKLKALVKAGVKKYILPLIDAENELMSALKEEIVGCFEGVIIVKHKATQLYYPKFSGRFDYSRDTSRLDDYMAYHFGAKERELSYSGSVEISGRADTVFYTTQLFELTTHSESKRFTYYYLSSHGLI
jgi:hypothetical protein